MISRGDDLPNIPNGFRMKPELVSLLHDLASCLSHVDSGLFRDRQRDQTQLMDAVREVVRYYDHNIYDGGEA